jgi:hypothetical protein
MAWEQGNYLKKQRKYGQATQTKAFSQLLAIPNRHMQTTLESLLNLCEAKGIKVKSRIVIP